MFNLTKFVSVFILCLTLGACSSDSSSNNDDDDIVIEENTSPVVDAGANQSVDSASLVTLAATITDDDSDYTVAWTQTDGTDVTLTDSGSASTTFTAPTVTEDETLVFEISVDDGVNAVVTDSVSITVEAETTTATPTSDIWIINETDAVSTNITDASTGEGVLVDVQSVTEETIDGITYTVVSSQGIPEYDVTITQDMIDSLNARPKASSDFTDGATTAVAGEIVEFGADIGYISTGDNCDTTGGYGYWPKGPACPQADEREVYFPTEPTPTTEACENGLGKVGLMVNGSSIYNWGDGMSWASDGTWLNLAPVAEQYDVDVCGGHSANGDYHHHFYTSCLATLLGDDGDEHSPIYGYAADGYPIYGPWESDGVLAISAWTTRDYSSPTSETGCADGTRSCTMVDPYDVSLGTETATDGPAFDETVTTLSQNELVATNGYYYEDYYWDSDLTALGGEYLDQYNAHTDSERGYHYHITLSDDGDGTYSPAFPYVIGLRFAGELEDNAVASCDTGDSGMGPPP
ncbi:YHYH protein [uncultured Paraglaciecola sp.]|uniref:YHYH protein n=1 Tax=uncultured Paraglaciecola sp. TaxID=1765024 RepID=UPI002591E8DC|nr:YHYH protein [uncultured Paraglaciecola sp.]